VTYAINEPCIGTKDTSCVEVCSVLCIRPTPDEPEFDSAAQLYIGVSGRLSGRSAVCRDHNVLLGAGSRPLDRRLEVVHRAPAVYPPPPAHRSQPDFATLPATSRIWSCTVRSPAASARRLRLKPATQTLEAPKMISQWTGRFGVVGHRPDPSASVAGVASSFRRRFSGMAGRNRRALAVGCGQGQPRPARHREAARSRGHFRLALRATVVIWP
jgi:NAD-dependent dihydropyrimidine dehydrogenase PreA subunit